MNRRDFIRISLYGGCGIAFGAIGGCGGVARYPVRVDEGRIVLTVAEFEREAGEEKAILLVPDEYMDPVALIEVRVGGYRSFSARCTHQGCTVRPSPDFIRCPCHGSVYDVDGKVLRGPASKPLAALPVEVIGERLVITLRP